MGIEKKGKIKTQARKRARALKILALLCAAYPKARIALRYKNNIQLLVSVILSAQCTDKKVNEVTKTLFKKYRTVHDFARASQKQFEREIKPTGFYRAKARNIIAGARLIEKDFRGHLPKTMPDMLKLSGVARKTANVVLGNAYGIVEGIAVDTHVIRLSGRLGFTKSTRPEIIEQDLMKLVPKKLWFKTTYYLIEHGRAVCTARNRKCALCPLNKLCPSSLV